MGVGKPTWNFENYAFLLAETTGCLEGVQPERDRGDYRAGVRFIYISPADLSNLKNYLGGL